MTNQLNHNAVFKLVDTQLLEFDYENPRLEPDEPFDSQAAILRYLWSEMSVDEVALSIAANGFFPEEPLFVIPAGKDSTNKDHYVVVEGNRRLAAVMVLKDDSLRRNLRITDLPTLTVDQKQELDRLPVSIYASKEELWEYLGFRHINGAKAWDAYSKAKYVAMVHEQYGQPLNVIAEKIGDRHDTVKRLYRGFVLVRQAEQSNVFDVEDRSNNKFYFSHFYTAADQAEFQKFIGIDPRSSLRPNPVPNDKLENLGELLIWIYGSKQRAITPVVRSQNPDLNTLRRVIAQPRALDALRTFNSLEKADDIGIGDPRRFRNALGRTKDNIIQALGLARTGYEGQDDQRQEVQDIISIASEIKDIMNRYTGAKGS